MMWRTRLGAAFLLMTMCMIVACSNNEDARDVPTTNQSLQTSVQASPEPEALQANVESERDVQPIKQASDSKDDKLESLGFDQLTKLELDGYYCVSFVATNTSEVIAAISSNGADDTKIIRIDLNSGRTSVMQESSDNEQIVGYSLELSDNGSVLWRTYNQNEPVIHTYQLDESQQVVQIDDNKESPDGRWVANATYDDPNQGIWGTDQLSDERKQWTTGPKDDQPLWLPDSSGFLFLHDTGDNLGDGAGPRYELAQFDIRSNKMTVLPFEAGYWGKIEWLEPGVSVLAHNGFDDVIGLQIVNLEASKEYQIVDTSNFNSLSSRVNPIEHQLLVSDSGSFDVYGSNGKLRSNTPWPTGFDEFTNKHIPAVIQSEEQSAESYYIGGEQGGTFGPSHLSFSPDGQRLSFLIGAIGESMDDKVNGTRIAVANSDGSGTKLVTNDYVRISNLQWSPDGTSILALFTLEEDRKQFYIGTIQAAT